jgi:ATP-dependent helicase/nuclease subunit B
VEHSLKEIWLGPLLGKNRSRLIERCAALVAADQADNFLYLAASQPLLEVVTEGILDGQSNRGVWGELPVYLFRGFVRHVLSTAVDEERLRNFPPRIPIDREELPLKRSLISQILKQLASQGKLKAIGPLAQSDGCVNTLATLIGEIQRAGKTPAELNEIIRERAADQEPQEANKVPTSLLSFEPKIFLQQEYDHEVALVYETYCDLLEKNGLTEDDTDGLRALTILRGEVENRRVSLPWLENAKLLILDGFFDFTPVQGEMLRLLIPRFPEVIVNLNYDSSNPDIFKPFEETTNQLTAIADFEVKHDLEMESVRGALAPLRATLFNPSSATTDAEPSKPIDQSEIRYFACTDRETEVRAIAKEIKRLVLLDHFPLSDIALVVRERESYAETIVRVMREEALPCNLNRRVVAAEIPAARAVLKLVGVLDDLARTETRALKMPQVADQIKSGYFRLLPEEIDEIWLEFLDNYSHLFSESGASGSEPDERRKAELRIGRWDADALENIIAYVGAELRLMDWLERCRKLVEQLPAATATKELLNIESTDSADEDEDAQVEGAETVSKSDSNVEKKRRAQTDVHPATLAWSALVIKRFAAHLDEVPREGKPIELQAALMNLLHQFQFRRQVNRPVRRTEEHELPRATLDLHALEALRRALLTTVKSIQLIQGESASVSLPTFIEELRRCLGSQTVTLGTAQRGGLRVLEATDVRGLRFRALFVAGLVEGGFPLKASRDWIYPHEERERLKRYGLVLEDISPETLLKEEHYFYQVACRATERLYLTRPLLLEGDNETVASYYVDELRRAIAPAEILTEQVVRPDYDGKQIEAASSARELTISLVRQEQQHLTGPDRVLLRSQPQVNRFLTLARNDGLVSESALQRILIERERNSASFGPYDGAITDPELLSLLSRRFGSDFVHSASGLGTFGNCPYRFFAERVLKLEPRGEAALDLQALDAGKLLHDILRRFFEKHRGERFRKEQCVGLTAELLQIADEVFDQHQRVVPPLNRQIWQLDRAIRKIILEQVLLFEIDIQEKTEDTQVAPSRFELAFGMTQSVAKDPHSVSEPLELRRPGFVGEETMKISGQIDRVDIAADNTLIAYDYKLSKGAKKPDIQEGRSLQIPIYLEALEQLFFPQQEIAGGGYYTLRGGSDRRNTGMYRTEFKDYLRLSAKNSWYSRDEWNRFRSEVITRIWDFLDRMRTGQFHVEPSEGYKTCKYCDFVAVCRYDKYRIERKRHRE